MYKINITDKQINEFKQKVFFRQVEEISTIYKNSGVLYNGKNLSEIKNIRENSLRLFKLNITNWINSQKLINTWIEDFIVDIKPFIYLMEEGTYYTLIDINASKAKTYPEFCLRVFHPIHVRNYNFVQVKESRLEER